MKSYTWYHATFPNDIGFVNVLCISSPLALAVLQDLFTKADKIQDDEPLHDFVERQATILLICKNCLYVNFSLISLRRFGEDVANFIVNPMVRGICAGDSREISAAAFIMGPLYREEMLLNLRDEESRNL